MSDPRSRCGPAAGEPGPGRSPRGVAAPDRPLLVCLDARIESGAAGGVQQAILGLATGLSRLVDGPERYLFLAWEDAADWLAPSLSGPCRLLPVARPAPPRRPGWKVLLERHLPPAAIRAGVEILGALTPPAFEPSDGTVERSGAEVMHFTHLSGFRIALPCVYTPHDLQHEHLPRFFSRGERRRRRRVCAELSRRAAVTVALTHWGKEDLVRRLGLPPSSVRVVGWAPIIQEYAAPSQQDQEEARRTLALPPAFAYFPAQTWPHKNHLRLLEALALLRDLHGLRIPLVCSGLQNEFFTTIARRVAELRLENQVRFLGFLTPLEVQCLYRQCALVVFPSLFEGFGMPVVEAFQAGVPLACSDATALPEVVGDAALVFDAQDAEAIAAALQRLWTDSRLREELVERGWRRVRSLTWDGVARCYRALYRLAARRPLTDEDRRLLEGMS